MNEKNASRWTSYHGFQFSIFSFQAYICPLVLLHNHWLFSNNTNKFIRKETHCMGEKQNKTSIDISFKIM